MSTPSTTKRLHPSHVTNPADCGVATLRLDDFDLQYLHRHCCHSDACELLEVCQRKRIGPHDSGNNSDFGVDFARLQHTTAWLETASILALSGAYDRDRDVIFCGKGRYRCKDTLLCYRCAALRGRDLVQEFGQAFSAAREVYYMVLSFNAVQPRLKVDEIDLLERTQAPTYNAQGSIHWLPVGAELPDTVRTIWNLSRNSIQCFSKQRGIRDRFRGALVAAELALRFSPLRVLPHTNALLWTAGMSNEDWMELHSGFSAGLEKHEFLVQLYPSIFVQRVSGPDGLRQILQYTTKPPAIAKEYAVVADRCEEPGALQALNHEVRAFLEALPRCFSRLPRPIYLGGCRKRSRQYFGHETEYRRKLREKNAARNREGRGARAKKNEASGYQPRKGTYDYHLAATTRHFYAPQFTNPPEGKTNE